jgi:hypothetical protein
MLCSPETSAQIRVLSDKDREDRSDERNERDPIGKVEGDLVPAVQHRRPREHQRIQDSVGEPERDR